MACACALKTSQSLGSFICRKGNGITNTYCLHHGSKKQRGFKSGQTQIILLVQKKKTTGRKVMAISFGDAGPEDIARTAPLDSLVWSCQSMMLSSPLRVKV